MIIRPTLKLPIPGITRLTSRPFSLGGGQKPTSNRILNSIRNASDFDTYMLLSSSSNTPLILHWTASWCAPCRAITPLIHSLLTDTKVGERNGNPLMFAEVELDAPDIGEVAGRYMITSIPMLLAMSRREPQMETRLTDVNQMKNRRFMEDWLEKEAARGGAGGAGGTMFGGLGRLFGGGS